MKLDSEVYSPKVTRYSDDDIVIRVNNTDATRLLALLRSAKTIAPEECREDIPEDEKPTSITHNNFLRALSIELVGEERLDGDEDDGGFEGELPVFYVHGNSPLRRTVGMSASTKEFLQEEFPNEQK